MARHELSEHLPGLLVLSYLGFLGFIPLLARDGSRRSAGTRATGSSSSGAWRSSARRDAHRASLVPALSCLYAIAMFFVVVLYTMIAILAIVKALHGQRLIVPGISRYASRGCAGGRAATPSQRAGRGGSLRRAGFLRLCSASWSATPCGPSGSQLTGAASRSTAIDAYRATRRPARKTGDRPLSLRPAARPMAARRSPATARPAAS